MRPLHLVQRGNEGVVFNRPILAGHARALEARDVETRELPDVVGNRVGVGGRKAELRQIEPEILRIALVAAQEPVVTEADIEDRRRVDRIDVIERHLA